MPHTTTATQLQRDFKGVVKRARKTQEPVVVLSNNKPEGIYMDYGAFLDRYKKRVPAKKTSQKSDFSEFLGVWSKEEAERFDEIIEDAFEQINPEEWQR